MNKKIILLVIVVLVVGPLLAILAYQFDSIQDMMKPPKLYGENAAIETAFESAMKNSSDIVLKYPTEGEYRSAYVLHDVDQDGHDEVLVFYARKSDETVVHIHVLDMIDGQWESVADIAGYGNEVLSISFLDMNNDGTEEILISWRLYESKSGKVVSIHKAESADDHLQALSTISSESYSFMQLLDLDKDGKTELFLTNLDMSAETSSAYAKLFKMNDKNQMMAVGEVPLDSSISGYPSFKIEKDSSGSASKIFIDANKGEAQMITEVIYWDNAIANLKAPFLDSETLTNVITLRSPALASMDVDDDGYIEIPKDPYTGELNALNAPSDNEIRVGITTWYGVENDQLIPKVYSLVNSSDLYILNIQQDHQDSFLAYNNIKQRTLSVYSKEKGDARGEELFSIITVAVGEWSQNPTEGYALLKRNESLVYAYTITDAGLNFGITSEMLSQNMKVIQ